MNFFRQILNVMEPDEKTAVQILDSVREILSKKVKPERITLRETKRYLLVMLDENNCRPICRFYLDKQRKYMGTFNNYKVETKQRIEKISDISKYSNDLMTTVMGYDR